MAIRTRTAAVRSSVIVTDSGRISPPAPVPAAAPGGTTSDAGRWYALYNYHSGLRLAVAGSRTDDGAPIIQWTPVNRPDGQASPEQDWLLRLDPAGWVFRNAGTPDRKALGLTDGTRAVQCTYDAGDEDQHWIRVWDTTGNYFMLRNASSGRCLGLPDSSTVRGAQAVQRTCDPSAVDQWWFLGDN